MTDDQAHGDITRRLREAEAGNDRAFGDLFQAVYGEMHRLAAIQRGRWAGDFTINTTALVHEVYEKLAHARHPGWVDRRHFFAVAARAMRQILYTYAEQKRAQKRGGDLQFVSLEDDEREHGSFQFTDAQALHLLAMEDALRRLEQHSPRESRIVECRFYLGMDVEETAEALGISTATVKRGWAVAKAWLYNEIK
jgi:RNA polymerase sigma factor (TIGR02999 family)